MEKSNLLVGFGLITAILFLLFFKTESLKQEQRELRIELNNLKKELLAK